MNNIEVVDAIVCAGTCEACICQPATKGKNEIIEFYASFYATSKATQTFCCLVIKGVEEGSWNRREWFALKNASFEEAGQGNKIKVSAPLWLLERKGILNLITKI
jgi:hypothetical protein